MNCSKVVFVCFLLVFLLTQSSAGIAWIVPAKESKIAYVSFEKLHPELNSLVNSSPLSTTKVLIEVKNEESLKEISLLAKNLGAKNIKEFSTGKIIVAEIPAEKLLELTQNSKVKFIYPDREIKAALNESISIINADTAWSYGFTGQGIKIAVLDTGIDSSHEMLQGKVVLEEDFSGTGNPTDVFGHGTHVAGIIAGTTANGGTYNGVAPNALLLNGKVLNDYGIGTSSSVIAGINWAVNPDGNLMTDDKTDIINLSLGAAYSDVNDPINLALRDAIQQGIVVVAAAGNCGTGCPSMTCGSFRGIGVPGDSPDAITVGAVDKQNNWACFSAEGNFNGTIKPDVSAPGISINSSIPNGYAAKSGTSMSAPFVSGSVALMLEANPLMTPQEIKQWLELNALDLGETGKDTKYGSGLIDLTNIDKINSQENTPPIFNLVNIPSKVLVGNFLELNVNVSDDQSISEVNAMIENPLGNQTEFNLMPSDNNFWSAEFNDTNTLGNYLIELRAFDNTGLESIINASFSSVTSINDSNSPDSNFFGFESELNVPAEIIKEIQGLISLNLFLVVSAEFAAEVAPQDTTIEFFVRDSAGKIINKEFVGPIEVPPNQNADFNYYWTSTIVNDYNIGAVVLAEGTKIGENEKPTLVTVPENSAEIISFNLSPRTSIEKGTTQHYLINARNNSMLSLNSFAEVMFFDSNNNLVHSVTGNNTVIGANSSFLFDLNENVMLKPGNYNAKAVLYFEDKNYSFNAGTITVFVPEIGQINSIEVPSEIQIDQNFPIKINFSNNGNTEINPVFFVEVIDGNKVIATINFGGEDVNANSTKEFDANWNAKIKAGNYDLNINAFYAGHELSQTKNFNVIDVDAPIIENISFNENVMQNSPVLIQAEFSDASDLNAIVSIQGTDYLMNKTSFSARDSNWNYTFSGTQNTGEYFFSITACDKYNNCFTSPQNLFNVNSLSTPCYGKKILVVERKENLNHVLNLGYCPTEWLLELNGSPSIEYLNRFNAVIWSEGNKITPIDENQAETLIEFVLNGGKLLLEGQDIGFNHFDDNFMQFVVHSAFFSDLILDENSNTSITISRKHPITFDFNVLDFNYELSSFPDSVTPINNADSIAEWSSGNSAIILFNDFNASQAKVLFLPFNLNALEETQKTVLLNNAIEWMLESASEDLKVNEISVPEFLVEDIQFDLNISLQNTHLTPLDQIQIFVDNELIKTINSNSNTLNETITLGKGKHTIKVVINPFFSLQEKYYLNNSLEKEFFVASQEADLKIKSLEFTDSTDTIITTEIENFGASNAFNVPIELYYDGNKLQDKNIDVNSNQTKTLNFSIARETGIHSVEIKVNSQQSVIEADYNNNNLTKELYVCDSNSSQRNVLIVSDNDTENYSTNSPESSYTFESILKNNGYCYEKWNEKEQGIPSISLLNRFNVLIWSTGNYWNTVIDENEMNLLRQYNGNILFEGTDIGFDHSNDSFLQKNLHVTFDRDLTIQEKQLVLNDHNIVNNIPQITIDGNISPYPDSVNALDANIIAKWPEANAAITSFSNKNKTIVYFAFSVDSIIEDSAREQLVVNSIEFLNEHAPQFVCGDADGDHSISISDVVFLINYIFGGGHAPNPLEAGDADLDGIISVSDVVYLVSYIFGNGPAPCSSN